MTVVSGAQWTGMIATKDATGALSAATVGPAGALYVNGVANLAAVAVAGVNPYSWTVTLPALANGDCVSMYITATIALVPTHGVVAEDVASTVYLSTRGTANAGDAMALTAGERTTTAMVFWNTLTTALVAVGSIGKHIVDYLLSIYNKTQLIGTSSALLVSPVTAAGNVTVIIGDSYLNADGRRIEWTGTTWNIAAGSTVVVIIQDVENFTATRLSATSAGLELTTAQTATLTEGNFLYSLQEVKAGGERVTLLQGVWESTVRPIPLV